MNDDLEQLLQRARSEVAAATDLRGLDEVRVSYLGKGNYLPQTVPRLAR